MEQENNINNVVQDNAIRDSKQIEEIKIDEENSIDTMVEDIASSVSNQVLEITKEEENNNELTNNNFFGSQFPEVLGGNEILKFTLSIFDEDKIKNICLNDFKKNIITFGRALDNDIILTSPLVSLHHGYFNLSNSELYIVDKKSKNGFFVNNFEKSNGVSLKDSDTIKIDNPLTPLSNGVLIVVTIGDENNSWKQVNLTEKKQAIIGRNDDCDIALKQVSISFKHAKIVREKNSYVLSPYDNKCGVILNGTALTGSQQLKDKDVIIINNIKLIYNKQQILYQAEDNGIRLDAIDIVKTVKTKGKKRNIAHHVDFSASAGEFIAFVGGSGAGKSTVMKCISGITKPTSGKVLINGSDLFNNYDILKKSIGYVPQDDIVFNDLTLIDMLKYAADLRMPDDSTSMEKSKRIDEVLEIVELLEKKDVMIRSLSGGQRKRASIAVELLADPKLFFLDEPTSGLDPGTERNVMKTLRKMANLGKTVILVTHNTLNLHLCDRVVFFGRGGKVCFDGKPKESLLFFGVNDFIDVYNFIDENSEEWYERFKKSKYRKVEQHVSDEKKVSYKPKRKSFFNQFQILLRRRLKTLFNNKQQLLLLLGQAPIIGFLMSLVVTEDIFYFYDETKSILFSLSIAAIWLGLLNAIQEVCKEKVILEKEYMADLSLSAYISSKVVYLMLAGLIQSILLVSAFIINVDIPQMGVMFNWYIETVLIVFLTIISASSMGLLVSILAKDPSVASIMPALLVVPQLLFSGIIFPLEGVVEKISNIILCRWSVEALGITNDLNSLITVIQQKIPGYTRDIEDCYTFTSEHLTNDLTIIFLMTVIFVIVSYYILKYKLERER